MSCLPCRVISGPGKGGRGSVAREGEGDDEENRGVGGD